MKKIITDVFLYFFVTILTLALLVIPYNKWLGLDRDTFLKHHDSNYPKGNEPQFINADTQVWNQNVSKQ